MKKKDSEATLRLPCGVFTTIFKALQKICETMINIGSSTSFSESSSIFWTQLWISTLSLRTRTGNFFNLRKVEKKIKRASRISGSRRNFNRLLPQHLDLTYRILLSLICRADQITPSTSLHFSSWSVSRRGIKFHQRTYSSPHKNQ